MSTTPKRTKSPKPKPTHGGAREGAGRPAGSTSPGARRSRVELRLTDDERERIERLARRHGFTVSEWIRLRALTDEAHGPA